ncbi:MAG: AAA family ATPase [Candidatus Lokiarchaeota archaeon]|nr:AAA family ATPase [Candidatus Lokiarchaeota archaeon]
MHVAIEGVDGVGKSTVCELLAKRLGFKFVEKPLHYLFDAEGAFDNYLRIRDYVNKQTDKVFTAWFYGLGNIFLYHRFKGEHIITDRHFLSNWFWSGDEASRPVFECMIRLIGKPDFTFILYADEEVVVRRLKQRDSSDSDLAKTHLVSEAYKKMEKFLLDYQMNYCTVDSSHRTPAQVVDAIIEHLSEDPSFAPIISRVGTTR